MGPVESRGPSPEPPRFDCNHAMMPRAEPSFHAENTQIYSSMAAWCSAQTIRCLRRGTDINLRHRIYITVHIIILDLLIEQSMLVGFLVILVLLTVSFRFQMEIVVFQFFMVEMSRSRAERGLIQFPIQFIFILFSSSLFLSLE